MFTYKKIQLYDTPWSVAQSVRRWASDWTKLPESVRTRIRVVLSISFFFLFFFLFFFPFFFHLPGKLGEGGWRQGRQEYCWLLNFCQEFVSICSIQFSLVFQFLVFEFPLAEHPRSNRQWQKEMSQTFYSLRQTSLISCKFWWKKFWHSIFPYYTVSQSSQFWLLFVPPPCNRENGSN